MIFPIPKRKSNRSTLKARKSPFEKKSVATFRNHSNPTSRDRPLIGIIDFLAFPLFGPPLRFSPSVMEMNRSSSSFRDFRFVSSSSSSSSSYSSPPPSPARKHCGSGGNKNGNKNKHAGADRHRVHSPVTAPPSGTVGSDTDRRTASRRFPSFAQSKVKKKKKRRNEKKTNKDSAHSHLSEQTTDIEPHDCRGRRVWGPSLPTLSRQPSRVVAIKKCGRPGNNSCKSVQQLTKSCESRRKPVQPAPNSKRDTSSS